MHEDAERPAHPIEDSDDRVELRVTVLAQLGLIADHLDPCHRLLLVTRGGAVRCTTPFNPLHRRAAIPCSSYWRYAIRLNDPVRPRLCRRSTPAESIDRRSDGESERVGRGALIPLVEADPQLVSLSFPRAARASPWMMMAM